MDSPLLILLLVMVLAAGAVGLLYLGPQLFRWFQVRRWRRAGNVMALTYDAGPDPETTPALLDLLDELGVRATFYLVGFRAEACPDMVRLIAERGHEVGAHSYSHKHAWKVPPWFDYRDAERGYRTLERIAGAAGPYRPPFGKIALPTLVGMLAKGRRVEWWSVPTNDTDDEFEDPETLARDLAERGERVILMHSHHPERHRRDFMLTMTRALVGEARRRGIRMVTMSELATDGAT